MKPFNLERALAGDPVVTRDGRKVSEIYWFKSSGSMYPVFAAIMNNDCIEEYTINGEEWDGDESENDLLMADTEEDASKDKFKERIKSLESEVKKFKETANFNFEVVKEINSIFESRFKQLEDAIAKL